MSCPSTDETALKSPQNCTQHCCNVTTALPWPHFYQQESAGMQEPHLPVATQKCLYLKRAPGQMDPMAFMWQFCPSAEREMRFHGPSVVLVGGNEIWIS